MWQLINRKTNTIEHGPGPLPENWGPIFGVPTMAAEDPDKIKDLSWLPAYADYSWEEVEDLPEEEQAVSDSGEVAWSKACNLLAESDYAMLPDVEMTNEMRARWIDYRRALRTIRTQPGFPASIEWPIKPA